MLRNCLRRGFSSTAGALRFGEKPIKGPFDAIRGDYSVPPTFGDLSKADSYFQRANVELEWSVDSYDSIPDVQIKQKYDEFCEEHEDIGNKEELDKLFLQMMEKKSKKGHKKTLAYVSRYMRDFTPEVMLLGRCNSGKTSLVQALCRIQSEKLALRPSSTAGSTRRLAAINIGGALRIIDTPGYGVKGSREQGKVILEYLQERRNFRRAYLLINLSHGIQSSDEMLLDMFKTLGLPFSIVATKCDTVRQDQRKVRAMELFQYFHGQEFDPRVAEKFETPQEFIMHVKNLPTGSEANLAFSDEIIQTAVTPKFRFGLQQLQLSMLQACEIDLSSKPPKVSKSKVKTI